MWEVECDCRRRWLVKLLTRWYLWGSIIIGTGFGGAPETVDAEESAIQAAIATVDITPPIGGLTTGYADAPPTDGIHDPVEARVLLLRTDATTIGLVACDLCIFNSPTLHARQRELGLDHLLLMNTHTHSGPNLRQTDFPTPESPWVETVEARIADAIRRAQKAWFPAYFAADEGLLQLGYNRLVREGEIAVTHFENPDRIPYGEVDPTVGVIRVTDDEQRVRAVIICYACHPVILGPKNRKISADYPGVVRREVERVLTISDEAQKDAAPPVCFFVQGGGGDINPLAMARGDDRSGDFALVERTGQLLATEVQRTLSRMSDRTGQSKSLAIASRQIDVAGRFAPAESVTLGVATLLINGEIAAMTMPGEPFHRFQASFRQRSRLPHAFLFGYCSNGGYNWPRYLPDLESAARGGYGASDTTVAEVGAGEQLVNLGLTQLFTLRGFLKDQPVRHIDVDSID